MSNNGNKLLQYGKPAVFGLIFLLAAGLSLFYFRIGAPPETVSYSEPVSLDYEQMRERGTIRMITRYNSHSYFLNRGMDRGFEYELVSKFAEKHDLNVEVVLLSPEDDPIELLNRGEGDLIAGNYAITKYRNRYVAFSQPYNLVNQVLVQPDHQTRIDDPAQLEALTISVRKNSSYYSALRNLQLEGYDITIDVVGEDWNTEALMLEVAEGRKEATIADDNLYRVATNYIDGLQSGFVLSESDTVAWAIRKNAPELKKQMDAFLARHFRIRESDGRMMRSAYLNILRRRYFEDEREGGLFRAREFDMIYSGYISPYDDVVKAIAGDANVDWKLVLAVMAQESEFNPNARSWAGAIGLMQIIPRFSQVENKELLYDPEVNIREGVRYLDQHLNRYAHLDSINRYSMALATYNIGMGHIADARKLALQLGNDPDEWEHVADALLLLMNRKYYQHARFGFKRGIETVNYVQDIMDRYRRYTAVSELAANFDDLERPAVYGIGRIE
ncbi:MAG: transporter substrate-binding domain-containing protein [Balneolales bacterium]